MDLHFTTSNATDIQQARSQVSTATELVALQEARVAALKAKGFPTGKAEALLSDTRHTLALFRGRLAQMEAAQGVIGENGQVEKALRSDLVRTE